MLTFIVAVAARKGAEWWQRRKALQAFAPARGWQWRDVLDSGAHYPFMAIPRLRWSAAFLQNALMDDMRAARVA